LYHAGAISESALWGIGRPLDGGTVRQRFAAFGMVLMQSGMTPAKITAAEKETPLMPGGPLAGSLVSGDFDLSAIGTVTHIDGNRVYGLGGQTYLDLHETLMTPNRSLRYDGAGRRPLSVVRSIAPPTDRPAPCRRSRDSFHPSSGTRHVRLRGRPAPAAHHLVSPRRLGFFPAVAQA
jgi:hypothetical protein